MPLSESIDIHRLALEKNQYRREVLRIVYHTAQGEVTEKALVSVHDSPNVAK